jgi:hypothetical protein
MATHAISIGLSSLSVALAKEEANNAREQQAINVRWRQAKRPSNNKIALGG